MNLRTASAMVLLLSSACEMRVSDGDEDLVASDQFALYTDEACKDPTTTTYGADPADNSTRDDYAIRNALQDGDVCLPAGTFNIGERIVIPSNRRIYGRGRNTILKRHANAVGGTMMLEIGCSGASCNYGAPVGGRQNIKIHDVTFDLNGADFNFSAIAFLDRPSKDVHIDRNIFINSDPLTAGGDRWAISLMGDPDPNIVDPLERIWITRNQVFDKMQLTANGGVRVKDIWITENYIKDGDSTGITTIACEISNLTIAHNRIDNQVSSGIFVGKDQGMEPTGCTIDGVVITGNIVGPPQDVGATSGITLGAMDVHNRRIIISNNVIAGVVSDRDHTGIRLDNDNAAPGSRFFDDVIITGNSIRDVDTGISVTSSRRVSIADNTITRASSGMTVTQSDGVRIEDNLVAGGYPSSAGLYLSGVKNATVADNVIQDLDNGSYENGLLFESPLGTAYINELQAVVIGNRVGDSRATGQTQQRAFLQYGSGPFTLHYIDNDFRNNVDGVTTGSPSIVTYLHNLGPWGVNATPVRHLTVTANLAFDLSTLDSTDHTVTVAGARANDTVRLGYGYAGAGTDPRVIYSAWVSADDTVTVRANKLGSGTVLIPSSLFRIEVIAF